jgi:hypothetical protein
MSAVGTVVGGGRTITDITGTATMGTTRIGGTIAAIGIEIADYGDGSRAGAVA